MAREFGERLRTLRGSKDLSQSELAMKCGLIPSAISHFESGRRAPSSSNLQKLADALAVTVDYLLGRTMLPHAAGPIAEQLLRDFERMASKEQEDLARFAQVLSEKGRTGRFRGNNEP